VEPPKVPITHLDLINIGPQIPENVLETADGILEDVEKNDDEDSNLDEILDQIVTRISAMEKTDSAALTNYLGRLIP